MHHKAFGLDIKAVSDGGEIEGYASVFGGAPDSYGDIVMPGAFAETLAKHRRDGTMPLMLWAHQGDQPPIGNWIDMAEDGKGLWVKGEMDLEDPIGARVHRHLKRKAMRGLSIGYETRERDTDPKRPGVNFLKAVDLWEVSPVNFPAQRRAMVDTVKSHLEAGTLPTVREFEGLLREAGFSKAKAVAIAAAATPHLRGEPEGKADNPDDFLARLHAALVG